MGAGIAQMDLINYGYSSDEYSDKEKENGSPAALSNEQIDDDMETDSLGLEPDFGGMSDSGATPNQVDTQQPELPMKEHEIEKPATFEDDGLPPSPPVECSEAMKARFVHLFTLKDKGINMNAQILNRKEFKNPAIYDKLKADFQVNEYGTNYPNSIKDNIVLDESDYYEKLSEEQSNLMEKDDQLKKAPAASTSSHNSHSTSSKEKDHHSRFSRK